MFNYQRFIVVILLVFFSIGVFAVTAANNVNTIQFVENPVSFFSPPLTQPNQNVDAQFPESSQHTHLHTAPVISPSYTNLWDFSFDLAGKPTDYRKDYEDLIKQKDYIYKENDTACGNCGPVPPGSFADPLQEDQLMPTPRTIQAPTPFIQPFQMIQYPFWEQPY